MVICGGGGASVLQNVEMMIEGCGFIHFRHGEAEFIGKRDKMGGCQATIFVLDQVKGFDQQIAPPGHLAEQSGDFCRGVRVNSAGPWA